MIEYITTIDTTTTTTTLITQHDDQEQDEFNTTILVININNHNQHWRAKVIKLRRFHEYDRDGKISSKDIEENNEVYDVPAMLIMFIQNLWMSM
jgi:hypothetical protein